MKKFYALMIILVAQSASGNGGWISSGGESFIFGRNPWFVRNTTNVGYCLEMDENSFSVTRDQVQGLITEAFAYWREEFSRNAIANDKKTGFAKIATQTFTDMGTCQPDTPLIFKLGLKKLNQDEVNHLGNPKKFIGVTIRKDYSLEQLTGSGVIYISADVGPDAYDNNGQLLSEAWRHTALLRYALIHELGHLFGIPHVGAGIMSEVFMTILLNKSMTKEFENQDIISFLNPQSNFEVCRISGKFNPDFFQVPKGTSCLRLESLPGSRLRWKVSALGEEAPPVYREVGLVEVIALDQSPYSLKPAVIVQLPEQQKVFSPMETLTGPFLVGAVFSDTSFMGSYRVAGQMRAQSLQMSLSAEKISFVGSLNNQQMTVLNYSPLGFMKAVLP